MAVVVSEHARQRAFYDYTECDGIASLEAAIRYINENGLKLISVTQNGDQYKVFFRRIAHG